MHFIYIWRNKGILRNLFRISEFLNDLQAEPENFTQHTLMLNIAYIEEAELSYMNGDGNGI